MPATLIFRDKQRMEDGSILEMRILLVPEPVPGSAHRLKYSLYFGREGQRIVGYDNERGKGDHRHLGTREEACMFRGVDQLIADFLADVQAAGGRIE